MTIRLNAIDDIEEPLNTSKKNRFKIAALSIIAMNRMKYLVRKYQRYLQKSSPGYEYKEKRGSSTRHLPPSETVPSATSVLRNAPEDGGNNSSDLSTGDMYPVPQVNTSPQDGKEVNKTKPMVLQDLACSPTYEDNENKFVEIRPVTNQIIDTSTKRDRSKFVENQPRSYREATRESSGVTGRNYRSSHRGFDSLRNLNSLATSFNNNNNTEGKLISPPPKSYPRPKSNVLREEYQPSSIENATGERSRHSTNRPENVSLERSRPSHTSTLVGGRSSQEDLKSYMKKLEDLQTRLKSQTLESRRSKTRTVHNESDGEL